MSTSRPAIPLPQLGLFVANEFLSGEHTMPVIDPATEQTICSVPIAESPEDVDRAVQAAHAAFKSAAWRAMNPHERGHLLSKLADLIDRDKEILANLEAWNVGKPAKMALWVDASTASRLLRYYAGWPDKLTGSVCPTAGGGLSYTKYEPLGVVACILPFNFPLLGVITKAAPALATGNTVVVKPAETSPLTALYLAQLVVEAGFPPGVFNVINGYGETTGAALVRHPLVRKVTFTGSTSVGKIIKKVAADTMKRVTLELGGKNPCIILEDADLDTAVRVASGGNYFNSGQICVGISRVFVPDGMYDEFIRLAAERASKRTVGDQWSGADQGPQASKEQLGRVLSYIDIGVKEGARLVCGGKRCSVTVPPSSSSAADDRAGYYVQPTIFADVTDSMTIAKEEIFGPVMCVLRYSTLEEVVKRANDTEYGLAATIVGKDISKCLLLANAIEAGTVWVNGHGAFDPALPYGGFKQSGYGREYGLEGLLAYVESKSVMVSLPASLGEL